MKRNELYKVIEKCVSDLLMTFNKKNYIVYKGNLVFNGTEVYETSNTVGYVKFELEPDCDIESELSARDLSTLAQKVVEENYKEYIYQIKIKKMEETDYISKIVLKLNFSSINDYINDLCKQVFYDLYFIDYEHFLNDFGELPFKYLMEEASKVYTSYKYNNREAMLKIVIENDALSSLYREIEEHLINHHIIKCLNKKEGLYHLNEHGANTYIKLFQKNGRKNIVFKAQQEFNSEEAIDKVWVEPDNSMRYTFNFVKEEDK